MELKIQLDDQILGNDKLQEKIDDLQADMEKTVRIVSSDTDDFIILTLLAATTTCICDLLWVTLGA